MEIAVLGDMELVLGMKLAGAKKCLQYSSEKIAGQIEELMGFPIVVMTEGIALELKEKKLLKELKGVVVRVPDKTGSKGLAMEEISKLFEDALGLKLENQG